MRKARTSGARATDRNDVVLDSAWRLPQLVITAMERVGKCTEYICGAGGRGRAQGRLGAVSSHRRDVHRRKEQAEARRVHADAGAHTSARATSALQAHMRDGALATSRVCAWRRDLASSLAPMKRYIRCHDRPARATEPRPELPWRGGQRALPPDRWAHGRWPSSGVLEKGRSTCSS